MTRFSKVRFASAPWHERSVGPEEKYHLDFEMFSEFRSQLVELHKAVPDACT